MYFRSPFWWLYTQHFKHIKRISGEYIQLQDSFSQRSVSSAAGVEMVAAAVLFFGGTIGWTLWRLFKSKTPFNKRSESRSSASDRSSQP